MAGQADSNVPPDPARTRIDRCSTSLPRSDADVPPDLFTASAAWETVIHQRVKAPMLLSSVGSSWVGQSVNS